MTNDTQSLRELEESIARAIDAFMNENPSVSWDDVLEAIQRVQDAIRRAEAPADKNQSSS